MLVENRGVGAAGLMQLPGHRFFLQNYARAARSALKKGTDPALQPSGSPFHFAHMPACAR
eukprot:scaffold196074_cov14-Tisochrysis_lutea.AAC.1